MSNFCFLFLLFVNFELNFQAKIEEDRELKVLERPDQAIVVPKRSSSSIGSSSGEPPLNAPGGLNEPINQIDEILGPGAVTVPAAPAQSYPLRQGGEDREASVRDKRDKIKEVSGSYFFGK